MENPPQIPHSPYNGLNGQPNWSAILSSVTPREGNTKDNYLKHLSSMRTYREYWFHKKFDKVYD